MSSPYLVHFAIRKNGTPACTPVIKKKYNFSTVFLQSIPERRARLLFFSLRTLVTGYCYTAVKSSTGINGLANRPADRFISDKPLGPTHAVFINRCGTTSSGQTSENNTISVRPAAVQSAGDDRPKNGRFDGYRVFLASRMTDYSELAGCVTGRIRAQANELFRTAPLANARQFTI